MTANSALIPPIQVLGLPLGLHPGMRLPEEISRLLNDCDRICGFRATLDMLADQKLSAPISLLSLPLEEAAGRISEWASRGEKVLVLCSGDPLFFGLGSSLAPFFKKDQLIIHPSPSSLQLACARIPLAWHNVRAVSLHGRNDTTLPHLYAALLSGDPVCVLLDPEHTPHLLARQLTAKGLTDYSLHIFRCLGTPNEEHQVFSLTYAGSAEREVEDEAKKNLATTLVLIKNTPIIPTTAELIEELTKESDYRSSLAVRSVAISLLDLFPSATLWDIGSGSGAVALECASRLPEGQITAIEKKPLRAQKIKQYARTSSALNMTVVCGRAQDVLPTLSTPDRVFIGGGLSGEDGECLLRMVTERLPQNGRIVISAVLFSTIQRCLNLFTNLSWQVQLLELNVSQAEPLAGDLHLRAQNPVFLIKAYPES